MQLRRLDIKLFRTYMQGVAADFICNRRQIGHDAHYALKRLPAHRYRQTE